MPSRPGPRHVVVLGAGIQGCSVALAMAHEGWDVTLLDARREPWSQTSLRGEGKLHLGYVYANEPDRRTAALMVDAALAFAPLIDSWLPTPVEWPGVRSQPFAYAVHEESMVDDAALPAHYAWVDDRIAATAGSYAGDSPLHAARPVTPSEVGLRGPITAAYLTSEVAVSPGHLRTAMLAGLRQPSVRFQGCTEVTAVERAGDSFVVHAVRSDGTPADVTADAVVNCLWHDRRRVDRTMDIHDPSPILLRLKHALHGRLRDGSAVLRPTTIALGPFGDVVQYPDGRVYVSWYPACMTATADDGAVPPVWVPSVDGDVEPEARRDIVDHSLSALTPIVPALEELMVDTVAAGVIVAEGVTDIDDPLSALHARERIGPRSHDGYVTVETGKLTAAPLHAAGVVEALRPWRA